MMKKDTRLFLQDTIISLIIISQNDEDIIKDRLFDANKALTRLGTNYEILIVDNNSNDYTVEKIRKLHHKIPYIRVLILSKQYDTEIALTAGLDNCIGDYAILFNIYTDPVDTIRLLLNKLLENYDIIIGKFAHNIVEQGFISKAFLHVVEKLASHEFYYRENYLTALNRKAINSIIRIRRKSRNLSYINYLIGLRKYTIKYKPLKKFSYKLKRQNLFELVVNVADIIISNSFRPMRILTTLGIFISLLFLMYVFVITFLDIFFHTNLAPKGWITVSAVLGTMFFLLFSLLTIIAEYVIRILNESRNEPFYFLADEIDKSTILSKQDSLNVV